MPWFNPPEHAKDSFKAEYRIPQPLVIINDRTGGTQVLDKKRKELATLLQEFKNYQKEFGANKDLETARFFKEEVREVQKNYFGICAVLDYAGSTSGDCKDALKNMTEEIAPYADRWFGVADLLLEQEQIKVMREMGVPEYVKR